MAEKDNNFHEFALKSILFKGRSDWYYCYLKSEKIAHVLTVLSDKTSDDVPELNELVRAAAALPNTVVHFAAGEVSLEVLLADVFILLSGVRLCSTASLITQENGRHLIQAYEEIAEKMVRSSHVSPFISPDDLLIEPLPLEDAPRLAGASQVSRQSIGHKGHTQKQPISQGHSARAQVILDYIKRHQKASIKDLSTIITDCSEKTIQRELALLIDKGLVRKEGERRWSVYFLV